MSERWDQVKDILGSALEQSPAERLDFVRHACGEDAELCQEVESLLANCDGADSLLESPPAVHLFAFPAGSPAQSMVGRQLGPHRILSEIGQGGMAVVYRAERADGEYRRQVAIKMVKPGANLPEIVRRFRNERQTLAALDHPHIVKLLDGGTTEEGWPYLVMDYVDGLPVDRYCDQHQLSIRKRLTLFREICAAVEYAHGRKVIHRDLKPGNILIAPDGVPRLLDFGIAKLLDPDWLETTPMTTRDRRPMTPEYASPEQVRGEPVTAATDIYSLGVLLYELLTGQRPYSASLASWPEIQRLVCEVDPPKPSTIGGASSTSPKELRQQLQGDIDTIVMTALRKEPAHRYASVEDLSNDVERYLSGLPVKARRPTLAYRSGKFLRRHVESVAAVAFAVALIVAFLAAFSVWQAGKNSKPKPAGPIAARPSVAVLGFKNLSGRGDAAWLSTALSEMLTAELASGGKLRLVPGETVARARIDLSLPDAESFAPDTLQRLRKNLGGDFVVAGSYLELGKGAGASVRLDLQLQNTATGETVAAVSETGTEDGLLALVSRSGADLRRRLGVPDMSPAETVAIKSASPSNPEAMRLYAQGLEKLRTFDVLAARDLLTRAVAADPSFSLAHSALAQAWQALGYDANSNQESKKALDLADGLPREDRLLVEARYAESTLNWDKAIETYRSLFSVFPDTLEYGLYLAGAQTRGNRAKEALTTLAAIAKSGVANADEPRIDMAVSEAASALDDDHLRSEAAERAAVKAARQGARLLVARARAQECRALANLGENDKATAVCEEGRRIYQEAGDRAGLARILHSMAEVPLNQDDLVTAERLYREALALTREIGDKRGMGRELVNLALIFKKRGDLATAQKMNEDSLNNYAEADDQGSVAMVTNNLGNLFQKQGKLAEALKYYERSLASSNRVGNRGNATIATVNVAETREYLGDLADAAQLLQQSLDSYRALGKQSYYATTLVSRGQVLEQQGNTDQAQQAYLDALSLMDQLKAKGDAAETHVALAALYCRTGRAGEAEPLARNAAEELARLKETDAQLLAQAVLSQALLQQGKVGAAGEIVQGVFHRWESSLDVQLRLSGALTYARWRAAAGAGADGERAARRVLAEAQSLGLVRFQLEALLALGEIQNKVDHASARATLQELESLAQKRGFGLMARRASSLVTP